MKAAVDPSLRRLFGGQTRVLVLGVLANSAEPLTAYRVAQMSGAQVSKTVVELRRLAKCGVARQLSGSSGPAKWILIEPGLREMLRRRVRIVSSAELVRRVGRRARRDTRPARDRIDLTRFRPTPTLVPNQQEFLRPRGKDRILDELGLPTSRHAARKT